MPTFPTTISDRFVIQVEKGSEVLLGQGGMGAVYRGIDRTTNEPVAIKLLRQDLTARDPDMLKRFLHEGEALRQLNHPGIVKMLDLVLVEGEHYLVMEFVPGGSLRDVLNKTPRLTTSRAVTVALDMADALTRAHRLNILHRDIKPDNVLIAQDGTPRLTDFGMARIGSNPHITQDGAIVGTLAYMAPELFSGSPANEKTDLWSFGVMLYEMLAGCRPFMQEQPGTLINAILIQPVNDLEVLRPDLPTALVDLVYRLLAKDPAARISSARIVGAELEAIMRGDSWVGIPARLVVSDNRFDTETPRPAPRTSQRVAPNNLPLQPTAFIGREREKDELRALLADPAHRLITLVGTGGIGKTRLAMEVGQAHLTQFADGVFLVSLAAVEDARHIPGAIAEAVNFNGDRDNVADMMNFFHEKHMLLIIDNVEHVASGATLLNDLLQAAPHIKMLVTSRERLRLRGETVYEVDNLAIPKRTDLACDVMEGFASVQLFLQSARRVVPEYVLTADDTPHVVAMLRMVQGLPLGIELAAAWLEVLPMAEIAQEIARSLDFLETDLRDVPERHRSVRAVFEYSWNLMTPEEQAIFVKLSIFRDGFERDAAEKVTGASLRLLTNLANKSLLQRSTTGRYYVHALLRQYAEQHLDPATRLEAYQAHGMYYGNFLLRLLGSFNSDRESAAMDVIEGELENARLAWQTAIETKHFDPLGALIDTLTNFYLGRSMMREGITMFSQLIDALVADNKKNTDMHWTAVNRRAWLMSRVGQVDAAGRDADLTYAYFKTKDNHIEMAHSLNLISYAAMMQSRYADSDAAASEAIELMADMKDVSVWFMAMGNYGYLQMLMGNLNDARYIYETLLDRAMQYPVSPSSLGYYLNNLGEVFRNLGDGGRALELFEQAYALFRAEKNLRGVAFSSNNLAGAAFVQGNLEKADEILRDVERVYHEIGDQFGLGHCISGKGNIAQARGDQELALKYYRQALELRRSINDKRGVGDSLSDVALIHLNQGDYTTALALIDEAIQMRRDTNDVQGLADVLAQKALGCVYGGFLDEADACAREALALDRSQSHLIQTQAWLAIAVAKHARGDHAEALVIFKQILGTQTQFFLGMSIICLLGVAEIYEAQGEYAKALKLVVMLQRHPNGFVTVLSARTNALATRLQAKLGINAAQDTIKLLQDVDLAQLADDVINDRI